MNEKSIIEDISEEQDVKRRERAVRLKYQNKIRKWREAGFVVAKLVPIVAEGALAEIRIAFEQYERDVAELESIRSRLPGIEGNKFKAEIKVVRAKLNDPDKLNELRIDIAGLEKKQLEGRMTEFTDEIKELKGTIKKLRTHPIRTRPKPVRKKITPKKLEIPGTIDEWKTALSRWAEMGSEKICTAVEQLTDEKINELIVLISKDKNSCKNYMQLVEKWNNNRYYRWQGGSEIIEVRTAYIGGLYCLSKILLFGEAKMYSDNFRYFEPVLNLYNKPENKLHGLLPIKSGSVKIDGEDVNVYSIG